MKESKPLVLIFATSSEIISHIDAALKPFQVRHIRRIEELLTKTDNSKRTNEPGEPMHGPEGSAFARIVDLQPALAIFDLDADNQLWRQWVPILKSSPASRRIPIICVAEQVNRDYRRQVKEHGADLVAPRARFIADAQQLIPKWARIPDTAALIDTCRESLSAKAILGLELFNSGEYYDCHEELEDAWNEDTGPGRDLYRGVLQVAVAYLQVERGNYNGAIKMLMRVRQWLDPLPDECRGIDIAQLRRDAATVYQQLQTLGRDRIAEFDQTLFRPVIYRT